MAFAIMLLVFEISIAVTMFSAFMIGDGAAAMVGRRIGHHKWGRKGCSVEGSLAFLVFGLLTAILIGSGGIFPWAPYEFPLPALLAGVAIGTVAEVAPWPINDNLGSPVGSAIGLAIMLQWVYGVHLEYFPVF
jgi:dolichol kinase